MIRRLLSVVLCAALGIFLGLAFKAAVRAINADYYRAEQHERDRAALASCKAAVDAVASACRCEP